MIYLFYGQDELTRSEELAKLKASIPPDLADLNISQLEGRRLKVDSLVAACEAYPFIAERRLVIVTDMLKNQKAGTDRDQIRAYLEQVPATCDLILVEQDDFDKRNTIFTYLKKAVDKGTADVREFTPKSGAELLRWLAERARSLGIVIEPAAAQRLVEFVGSEGRALANELDKLASYVGRGKRITATEVDLLVQDNQEQNLFAFIDELSQRHRAGALRGLHRLFDDGQAATYILFMVARQVRILLSVKELASRRMRADDIAAQLGQRPFVVRKALDQTRGFNDGELETLHDRILQLDQATKTGRADAETALDILVMETCR